MVLFALCHNNILPVQPELGITEPTVAHVPEPAQFISHPQDLFQDIP
jgi:hypothetical protein